MEIFVALNLEHIFLRVLELSIQVVLNVTVLSAQATEKYIIVKAIRHTEV